MTHRLGLLGALPHLGARKGTKFGAQSAFS